MRSFLEGQDQTRSGMNMVMKWSRDQNCRNSSPTDGVFNALDADQILAILQFLPVQAVIAFGLTCNRFRKLVDTDSIWACICVREWGTKAVHAWPSIEKDKGGWKRVYRQMLVLRAASWHKVHQGDLWPAPRASHSMISIAGKVTVYGGGCFGGRHLDDTWVASLPGDVSEGIMWQQASSSSPSGRFGQSCTVVDDTLVLFGGINDTGIRQCDTWVNRRLARVNLCECPAWEMLEVGLSPPSRGAHAGCHGGDQKIIIFGGIGAEGIRLGDTWVLDLAQVAPSWHEVLTPVSPSARSGHSLTWIGGKRMVLFGGRGTRFEVLNDVWLLDMEEELPIWVELRGCELQPNDDCPTPRAGHSASLIFGGRILIFGGEDSRRSRKGGAWVLDPNAGVQVGRSSSCMENFPSKALNEGKLAARFWKKLKQWGQPPSRRSFHGACALDSGHSILVFGGMVDGELQPAAAAGLGFDSELHVLQLVP